ncbi:DUF3995 domain-containing protein [Leucobacter chromiireducens]|uniref:DUF3995 domain-containing protein n=1 Tax=Leucobacter chromiireducens TaxID=283877 RepID=UPI000F630845|nr:DUF3995 domain-containing protein [Leucobacter chromiireducens]
MSAFRRLSRVVSGVGLGVVAALHAAWASGSSWPARNRKELTELVVGNRRAMPSPRATATVAGVAGVAAVATAGAFGEGKAVVRGRRLVGLALLGRAALGGDVALALLDLPPAGKKFQRLDARWYRPLCAVLGLAVLCGARRRPDPQSAG